MQANYERDAQLPGYFPALDGLRALAILMVIPHNLNQMVDPASGPEHLLVSCLDRGWIGVQLFFVLSGFLITGILIDAGSKVGYFARFYTRRAFRIMPLYFVLLLLLFVVLPSAGLFPESVPRYAGSEMSYWLFYANWYGPFHEGQGSMSHLWSLAVEEQFYLIWPLILWRRDARQIVRICLAIAVAGLAVRIIMLYMAAPTEAIYSFLISRMDGLALGGLVAAALRIPTWRERVRCEQRRYLWAAVMVLLAGAAVTRGYTFSSPLTLSLGYTLLAISFALLIGWIASQRTSTAPTALLSRILETPLLRLIGRRSYAMYLVHLPLHVFVGLPWLKSQGLVGARTFGQSIAYAVAMIGLTFVASAIAYVLIERPFLGLRPDLSSSPSIT